MLTKPHQRVIAGSGTSTIQHPSNTASRAWSIRESSHCGAGVREGPNACPSILSTINIKSSYNNYPESVVEGVVVCCACSICKQTRAQGCCNLCVAHAQYFCLKGVPQSTLIFQLRRSSFAGEDLPGKDSRLDSDN